MKTRKSFATPQRALSLLALLGGLTSVTAPAAALAQLYLPTDIVAPEGAAFYATALNDSGQVCGSYVPPGGPFKPAVWQDGVFTLLPVLHGTAYGTALGLNNVGQVVGYCSNDNSIYNGTPIGARACVWENGTVRELVAVAGATYSKAVAINDAGTVVGQVYSGPDYDSFTEAVIWKGSIVAKLPVPLSGAETYANAIDNSGRIAAEWVKAYSGFYAGRWVPNVPNGTTGTMEPLVSNTSGHLKRALDINNAGTICGETMVWYGVEGFELPFPTTWCHANGINDAGMVVGNLEDEESGFLYIPFVWDAGNGMRDLNTLLAASTPNAYPGSLESVIGINNAGQILVRSYPARRDSLLTPSLEPPGPQLPAPPQSIGAGAGDRVVSLSWNSVYFATGYNLKRSTASGGPYMTVASNLAFPGFEDTSVVNGTRYYYVISSLNGAYESVNSQEVSAKPLAPPVSPTTLTATLPKGGRSVQLKWNQSGSPEIAWNRVYRSANGGAYAQIAQVNAETSYTDNTTGRRTTYQYFVTAVNVNGQESAASNVASVRTK